MTEVLQKKNAKLLFFCLTIINYGNIIESESNECAHLCIFSKTGDDG